MTKTALEVVDAEHLRGLVQTAMRAVPDAPLCDVLGWVTKLSVLSALPDEAVPGRRRGGVNLTQGEDLTACLSATLVVLARAEPDLCRRAGWLLGSSRSPREVVRSLGAAYYAWQAEDARRAELALASGRPVLRPVRDALCGREPDLPPPAAETGPAAYVAVHQHFAQNIIRLDLPLQLRYLEEHTTFARRLAASAAASAASHRAGQPRAVGSPRDELIDQALAMLERDDPARRPHGLGGHGHERRHEYASDLAHALLVARIDRPIAAVVESRRTKRFELRARGRDVLSARRVRDRVYSAERRTEHTCSVKALFRLARTWQGRNTLSPERDAERRDAQAQLEAIFSAVRTSRAYRRDPSSEERRLAAVRRYYELVADGAAPSMADVALEHGITYEQLRHGRRLVEDEARGR